MQLVLPWARVSDVTQLVRQAGGVATPELPVAQAHRYLLSDLEFREPGSSGLGFEVASSMYVRWLMGCLTSLELLVAPFLFVIVDKWT